MSYTTKEGWEMLDEINELKTNLALAVEALEFYARPHHELGYIADNSEYFNEDGDVYELDGKKARAALEKLRGEK